MSHFNIDHAKEIAQNGTDEQVNKELAKLVHVDRRVISRKETVGYMIFDGSSGFNINGHKELFLNSYIKVSLEKQSLFGIIAGIWDVIDDFLIGSLIEKTRTRWGKFIPYLFLSGIPYAVLAACFWFIPLLFSPEHLADFDYMPKFFLYMAIEMLSEAASNFKDVARGGYVSTMTPFPSDRRRLLSITNYFSIIYSRIPDLVVEFMLDFVTNGIVNTKGTAEQAIGKALMIIGPFTALLCGLVTTWYATLARERVRQKVQTPKIIDSVKLVIANRPVLAYYISNALGSFGTGVSTNDYYRYVLFMTTFETIAGIPSFFFQPIGFSQYNKLAARFSTKSMFMISQVFAKSFYIPLWFYGRFLKTKDGKPFFTNRIAMLPVTAVWECIYATFWGVKSISGTEISNEINDYIEWKSGCRNEAMLACAGTIITKIPGRINGILTPLYKKWVHFDQAAYTELREQPEGCQRALFAMCTLITAFMVLGSMVPMFWYNIDKPTRDRMYRELNERRVATAELINAQNSDGEPAEE